MYEKFFGLTVRPFDLVPNPRFLYPAPPHREALSNLRYGLSIPRGLTLLLGEAGTGKTTLLQTALADIDPATIECVLLSNPTLTRDEFLAYLADGFKLGPDALLSKTAFLVEFRAHLEARRAAGLLTALVLDEAQSLPYELLEEVRLLSNIETPTEKLLNVVLAGQPELATRLNEPSLRQLKQRISLRCELRPLNFEEVAAYIAGRIRLAGGEPAKVFSREAILAIAEASAGIPRTINVICDNALLGAFASNSIPVLKEIVDEVRRDFDLKSHPLAPSDPDPVPITSPEESGADDAGTTELESDGEPVLDSDGPRKRFLFF